MNTHSAASAYQEATFENAPPIKIIHMMYEGAIRFLTTAQSVDPEKQFREYNESLNRAEAIVAELRLAIDPAHSPELGEQLDSLYRFVESQIREAFLDRLPDKIDGAISVLNTLLEGWRQIQVDLDRKVA